MLHLYEGINLLYWSLVSVKQAFSDLFGMRTMHVRGSGKYNPIVSL